MTLSRSSYFPILLILGTSFGTGFAVTPALAKAPDTVSPSSQQPPAPRVVEDIVARINDQIITQSDYDRALQQLDAEAKQQDIPPQELEQRKNNLLRDQIDQQLLLSRGKELGITGEAELVRRLDDIRKQNHLDTMEDLEKAAAAQGVSYEDFKANIRNSIITQQVVRDEVGRRLNLTEPEVEAYYKAHESEFAQPESVHLSEILIPTPADPSASQVQSAQASADAVVAKLRAGANFADLAKASSSGPTAAQGGDLGVFRHGMLAPELEKRTFSLQAGQFTEPIRTKQGFVILEVTQHTAGGDAAFKQVEPQVEQAVFLEHMQPALRKYLTKLRESAYIDIKPGFVDSGASPNEIRPTYSAYAPPAPKKKQHFTRMRFHGSSGTPAVRAAASAATTPAATTAAGTTAPAGTAVKNTPRTVAKNEQNVQKPGKKEKIRFGQAPRESLPSSQTDASGATAGASTQSASAANPDIQVINPDGSLSGQGEQPVKKEKTRFSDRPVVHKTKQQKAAAAAAAEPPPPTTDELATQKAQGTPLGLADQNAQKKKKVKGEKTRLSARPKQPEQVAQPYQQQNSTSATPSGTQPASGTQAPSSTPPASNAPAGVPPQ